MFFLKFIFIGNVSVGIVYVSGVIVIVVVLSSFVIGNVSVVIVNVRGVIVIVIAAVVKLI